MSKSSVSKNWKSAIGLVIFFALFCGGSIYYMFVDYGRMQAAPSGFDYCSALCDFTQNAGHAYFALIAGLVCHLIYDKRKYSRWSIRLYYLWGASILVYFLIAGFVFNYSVAHIEVEHMAGLSSLAKKVFLGPGVFFVAGYFIVPKILKDMQKLKEEQELTI